MGNFKPAESKLAVAASALTRLMLRPSSLPVRVVMVEYDREPLGVDDDDDDDDDLSLSRITLGSFSCAFLSPFTT